MDSRREGLVREGAIALFCASTLFFFGPLTQYYTNRSEFTLVHQEVLLALAGWTAAAWLAIWSGLLVMRSAGNRWHSRVLAAVAAFGLLWWVQGTLLVGVVADYGILDGRPIDWRALRPAAITAFVVVWVPALAYALLRPRQTLDATGWLAATCVALQGAMALYDGATSPTPPPPIYTAEDEGEFDYSSNENVILLVLDAFQSDVFQQLLEEDPEVRGRLEGFTYFRNALAGVGHTNPSIQNILTGWEFDNSIPIGDYTRRAYLSEASLPKRLKDEGFYVGLHTFQTKVVTLDDRIMDNLRRRGVGARVLLEQSALLIDVAWFRHAPDLLKPIVLADYRWLWTWVVRRTQPEEAVLIDLPGVTSESLEELSDLRVLQRMVSLARTVDDRPRFRFHHILGIHLPLKMDAELRHVDPPLEPTRENYLETGRGVLQVVERFLAKLRELGIYDRSVIVIAADHGTGRLTPRNPQGVPPGARSEAAPSEWARGGGRPFPLVLVKPLVSREPLRISDAPVRLGDIPKTAVALLGRDSDALLGRNMFDVDADETRPRAYGVFMRGDRRDLHRFTIRGFAWDAAAWRDPARVTEAPSESNIASETKAKSFLADPEFYTQVPGVLPRFRMDELNAIAFPASKASTDGIIGMRIDVTELAPGRRYRLSFEVLDVCYESRPQHFRQVVTIDGDPVYEHDLCGNDNYVGWQSANGEFVASGTNGELDARVAVLAVPTGEWDFTGLQTPDAWRTDLAWHQIAVIGIRNIQLTEPGEPSP